MSAPTLHFTPRSELEPLANLKAFVALCKGSEVLGAKTQFEQNIWNVGYLKGHNKVHRIVFSTLEASREKVAEPSISPPFLEFAKATLVYLQDSRPVVSQCYRIAALRALEAALREWNRGSRPTAVDEEVFDTAVELARKNVSPAVAYHVAGQLSCIAKFMCSMEFIYLRRPWIHGLKKPNELGSRISKEAMKARQEKLPSAEMLRALGGIFCLAKTPADVMVSGQMALLACAPERINEAMRLPRNCEVYGTGEYLGRYGLRWMGSKGFENTTKWLPTEMVPVAQTAVRNLLQVTAPAQTLAAWYTANPTKLFLHEGASHLRGQEVVNSAELALILWGDKTAVGPANLWAQKTHCLNALRLAGQRVGYLFADVERAVLAMLPPTFPYVPGAPELLCMNSMVVMLTNEMHGARATYLCMFSCVSYTTITSHLGSYADRKSIFERYDYREADDSPLKLKSKSLRHYMNMVAHMTGLSSTEIALFSGRKDARQNRSYDHMSSDEVQAPISRALRGSFTAELEPAFGGRREPILRTYFKALGLTAGHTTEYGWCAHVHASEPCHLHRDCINCGEHVCIKGQKHKEANLLLLKEENEYLLKQALEAYGEEEYGADRWVKHATMTLERVDTILAILKDPTNIDGGVIRLDIPAPTLITTNKAHTVPGVEAPRRIGPQ